VGGGELGLAAVLLVASALLTSLAPPSSVRAAPAPKPAPHVSVAGADFGTTLRVRLDVSPGRAGPNRFALTVADYDTGRPLQAAVRLRFAMPARDDVGESDIELTRDSRGVYRTRASNLSLVGRWTVTAVVQERADSVEVPLEVQVTAPPPKVTEIRTPGQPTITIQDGPAGKVQVYLETERPGTNELHVTYLDAAGQELAMPGPPTVTAVSASGKRVQLSINRYTPGHFGAAGTLAAGRWTFDVKDTAPDGSAVEVRVDRTLQG